MQFGDLPQPLIRKIMGEAKPLMQSASASDDNLGYGFIYYGLIRSIRPKHVLTIGSGHGFMPVCAGLAVKDNGKGRVTFVDPAYAGVKQGTMGVGKWSDPKKTREFFGKFGLEDIVTHYEFFNDYRDHKLPPIDFAIIDGSHTYENVKFDLMNVLQRLKKGGLVLLHDSDHPAEFVGAFGVRQLLEELDDEFNVINIPGEAGLAILQRKGQGYVKTKYSGHIRNALCICIGLACARFFGI